MALQKHSKMIVHQEQPLNAGIPIELLREQFLTLQECFFVRNHGDIPTIKAEEYRLTVDGLVDSPLELTFDAIKAFPPHTVMATLQCAGSRRDEMSAVRPIPGELLWGAEPISNAIWRGTRLRDILEVAQCAPEAHHVSFIGLDDVERLGKHFGFGGSIPLYKALCPDVLLAYEMNNEPLAPTHGYPIRVVVPGFIGARSVKWLSSITVQEQSSTNYFQAHAYKLFPPDVTAQNVDWNGGLMLEELPLHAVICQPREGATYAPGAMTIKGYAMTGNGSLIERVEASTDCGETWIVAQVMQQEQLWSWCFWEAKIVVQPGEQCIMVRAWDSSGMAQPEDVLQVWNFKGYMNNSWHKVRVHITPSSL